MTTEMLPVGVMTPIATGLRLCRRRRFDDFRAGATGGRFRARRYSRCGRTGQTAHFGESRCLADDHKPHVGIRQHPELDAADSACRRRRVLHGEHLGDRGRSRAEIRASVVGRAGERDYLRGRFHCIGSGHADRCVHW